MKWYIGYLLMFAIVLQGCTNEGAISVTEDASDISQTDVSSYLSGDVLESDAQTPFFCECASDLDCADHFRGQGPCQKAACDLEDCTCVIQQAFEGEPCDDGDKCTLVDLCESGACLGGNLQVCVDGNECTADSCDGLKGCVFEFISDPCDDGNPCTSNNLCEEGVCGKGEPTPCDDNNNCTLNGCSPAVGCTFDEIGGACDDGDFCTVADTCKQSACVGDSRDCDDGNLCTTDSCDDGCIHQPTNNPCDDGLFCTFGDFCSEGDCVGGSANPCNDGNLCTEDICKSESCGSIPLTCDDGDLCTTNSCDPLFGCKHAPVFCGEGTDCLRTECVSDSGCVELPIVAVCDDGNPCTVIDECDNGLCGAGIEQNCDDGESCTVDSCVPDTGCVHIAAEDEQSCDDGNVCSVVELCLDGVCVGNAWTQCDDGNPCTDDWCDVESGCQTHANQNACDDGLGCTEWSHCEDGVCLTGVEKSCDDGDSCTVDFCVEGLGCLVTPLTGEPCDDGLVCNGEDTCLNGSCLSSPCFCDLDQDCQGESPCRGEGSCQGGLCVFENAPVCTTTNPCLVASCDDVTGECVELPVDNGVLCSDGDSCTHSDGCASGVCVGQQVVCDDENPCTEDECTDGGSCSYLPSSGGSCSFGNCDDGGVCQYGVCTLTTLDCPGECQNEMALSCGDIIRSRDLKGVGQVSLSPCGTGYFPGPELFFKIEIPDSGQGDLLLNFTVFDPGVVLFVLEGEQAACKPDECEAHTQGPITLSHGADSELLLRVDSVQLEGGRFSLGLQCTNLVPPATCENAGEPGCDSCSCSTCVCESMPSCCEDEWTKECSQLCEGECGGCDVPDPCIHQGGTALDVGGTCQGCVCALDSMCCAVQWDGVCAALTRSTCSELCGCQDYSGSCCEVNADPGCNEPSCNLCVCSDSPHCCELAWDEECTELSTTQCSGDCSCANASTTCCAPHSTAGCEDSVCEACVCEQSSHCCDVAWDGECISLVEEGICQTKCPCTP